MEGETERHTKVRRLIGDIIGTLSVYNVIETAILFLWDQKQYRFWNSSPALACLSVSPSITAFVSTISRKFLQSALILKLYFQSQKRHQNIFLHKKSSIMI